MTAKGSDPRRADCRVISDLPGFVVGAGGEIGGVESVWSRGLIHPSTACERYHKRLLVPNSTDPAHLTRRCRRHAISRVQARGQRDATRPPSRHPAHLTHRPSRGLRARQGCRRGVRGGQRPRRRRTSSGSTTCPRDRLLDAAEESRRVGEVGPDHPDHLVPQPAKAVLPQLLGDQHLRPA